MWFYYKTYEKPLGIIIYRSNPSLLPEIIKYFDCLFPVYTKGIEDICFFSDTDIIFGSVTHEGIAKVIISQEKDIKEYQSFGSWKKDIITSKDYEFFPNLNRL